jgi:uncharacterized protein YqhQ
MADFNVGGQAVIEGVMMRSADKVATAVRIPSGEIVIKSQDFKSVTLRHKILGIPIIRGAVSFFEMLIIGFKTLNFSAEIAAKEIDKEEAAKKGEEYQEKKGGASNIWLWLTTIFALGLGVGIFFFLPLAISSLFDIDKNAVGFNLLAGVFRITIFLAYVWALTFSKEFQRVFEYHGAEHKAIFTYEMKSELTPETAATFTRFHPRCGTSFVLIVALFAIFVYAISDSIYASITGQAPELLTRFAVHFSLLPLVAGGSYEMLKFSAKKRNNKLVNALIQPGLWLQRLTTKEPNSDQLEVAIVALESALGITSSKIEAKRTPVY